MSSGSPPSSLSVNHHHADHHQHRPIGLITCTISMAIGTLMIATMVAMASAMVAFITGHQSISTTIMLPMAMLGSGLRTSCEFAGLVALLIQTKT